MSRLSKLSPKFPFIAFALLFLAPSLNAQTTHTVVRLGDGAPGTLRHRLSLAVSGDTIEFAGTFDGRTIVLVDRLVLQDLDITIDASALPNGISLSGDNNSQILELLGNTDLTVRKVTFREANPQDANQPEDGGAINALNPNSSITLSDCRFESNAADRHGGAIAAANVIAERCAFASNIAPQQGGAIWTGQGTSQFTDCSFDLNDAGADGGAIAGFNSATVLIERCTFSRNEATVGGALWMEDADLTITNSTLALNQALTDGGAIFMQNNTGARVELSTLADNSANLTGGGISVFGGSLELENSVLADNSAPTGPDLSGSASAVAGVNFIGDPSGAGGLGTPGTDFLTGDPRLLPLGDNGGPTETQSPAADSPLIDAGINPPTPPATDQRGEARLIDGSGDGTPTIDLGAVESEFTPLLVTTNLDEDDGALGLGAGNSLRECLAEANSDPGVDRIVFDQSLDGAMITLGGNELTITSGVTVSATSLAAGLSISGNNSSRVFQIPGSFTVCLEGLTIRDGHALGPSMDGQGGGIRNQGLLSLHQCRIAESEADQSGGGIYSSGGLTMSDTTVEDNIAGLHGGGVATSGGTNNFTRAAFHRNEASASGGGLHTGIGTLSSTVTDCTIDRNTATDGGGIANETSSTLARSTLSRNTATQRGGGAYSFVAPGSTPHLTLVNSTVALNRADVSGGGIELANEDPLLNHTLTLLHTTVVRNRCELGVAGVEANGLLEIGYSIVASNTSPAASPDLGLAPLAPTIVGPSFFGTPGDIDPVGSGDPFLAPLGNYGGPSETAPPMAVSSVIDMVDASPGFPATDQRGLPRILDGNGDGNARIDMGAVEFNPAEFPVFPPDGVAGFQRRIDLSWSIEPGADSYEIFLGTAPGSLTSIGTTPSNAFTTPVLLAETTYFWRIDATTGGSTTSSAEFSFTTRANLMVTTALDEDDGALGLGVGDSLREILAEANFQSGFSGISFDPGLNGATAALSLGELEVASDVLISGLSLTDGIRLSGDGLSRVFRINPATDAFFHSLTIADGNSASDGGGIYNEGTLNVDACTIVGNSSAMGGGGIQNQGTLTVLNSTLTGNSAGGSGGGIANEVSSNFGSTTVNRCSIIANSAGEDGGGIFTAFNRSLGLHDTVVAGNSATDAGADIRGLLTERSGVNFVGSPSGAFGLGSQNIDFLMGDPLLLPLGDYGGPTDTFVPRYDSPVVDAGGSSPIPATDQRGSARLIDGDLDSIADVDIGAVEFDPAEFPVVPFEASTGISPRPFFWWSFMPGADSYEVLVGTDPGSLQSIGTSTTNTFTATRFLAAETTYFWRIDATAGGITTSSTVFSFTTQPFDFVVTTAADEDDGGLGLGGGDSLREVIAAADADPELSTIGFDAGLDGATITLGGSELTVSTDLLIDASPLASGVTISGADASRVFQFLPTATATLKLLEIRDGTPAAAPFDGGGIANEGDLTMIVCTVTSCSSSADGGGLFDEDGSCLLERCTFHDNTASRGGAVFISRISSVTFDRCTIANNQAGTDGGGIYTRTFVSGVSPSDLTIMSSTIVGNRAGPTGGVYGIADLLANSIIAHNISSGGSENADLKFAPLSTLGPNLVGNSPDFSGRLHGDPGLHPLGDYGGPTLTAPLLYFSAAIDAGNDPASPLVDQRGLPRLIDGDLDGIVSLDLGAVEFDPADIPLLPVDGSTDVPRRIEFWWTFGPGVDQSEIFLGTDPGALASIGTTTAHRFTPPILRGGTTYFWRIDATTGGNTVSSPLYNFTTRPDFLVTTVVDEDDGALGLGSGDSLRECLAAAPLEDGFSGIGFDLSLDAQTITLASSLLTVDSELIIDASPLPGQIEISGDDRLPVFYITAEASAYLQSLTIRNGLTDATGGPFGDGTGGGGVTNLGELIVSDCVIENCSTVDDGGGIRNGGTLTVSSSTFSGNSASEGGAIYNSSSADNSLTDVIIVENSAPNGGGIANVEGTLNLTRCTLDENNAARGGGCYSVTFSSGNSNLSFENCCLARNQSSSAGGGLYVADSFNGTGEAIVEMENCTVARNNGGNFGGGIVGDPSYPCYQVMVTSCTIVENTAQVGGGCYVENLTLANSIVAGNQAGSFPDVWARIVSGELRITTVGPNLIGTPLGSTGEINGDPLLLPLGHYGGPTETAPPVPGSPVIDIGIDPDPSPTDQRGFPRILDGNGDSSAQLDLGAAELDPAQVHFSPTDGEVMVGRLPTLLWTSSPFADSHEVFLGTDPGILASLGTTSVGALSIVDRLLPDTTYFWRVDSTTGASTVTGTIRQFTTRPLFQVTTTFDENDDELGMGSGDSLRELTTLARELPGTDFITFHPNLEGAKMEIQQDYLYFDSELEISAAGFLEPPMIAASYSLLFNSRARLESLAIAGTPNIIGTVGINVGSAAHLELVDCTVSEFQGSLRRALQNFGNTSIRASTIQDNASVGIFNFGGTLTIDDSLVAANVVNSSGAAIWNTSSANLTIQNSTLTGNQATSSSAFGGGLYNEGTASLRHVTVAGNHTEGTGGGIFNANGGSLEIENSIVAGNTSNGIDNLEGLFTGANNLLSGDPRLRPLAQYGGPTRTRPPLPISPAIEAGGATTLALDQRGYRRFVGSAPDMGAVELQQDTEVTSALASGLGSLPRVVVENVSGTITFDPSLDGQMISLSSGPLLIGSSLQVDGASLPTGITLSGDNAFRVAEIAAGAVVELRALNIRNGRAFTSGGAIRNAGDLHMHGCTVADSLSFMDGGGIWNTGALILENTTLSHNLAADSGGGIGSSGTVVIRHSTVTDNEAFSFDGGGVFNQSATLTLENSIVAGNRAAADLNLSGTFTELGNNLLFGDPRLAPLANYGGPTLTRPPLPDSPALEGAVLLGSTPPSDQLGNPRPSGPLPDIGAVEAISVAAALSPLTDSEPDGIPDLLEGPGSAYPHLDPTVDDSALDSDADGSLDAVEIANMTDPLDGNDLFRILSIGPAPGFHAQLNPLVEVTVATFPGLSYAFETDKLLKDFLLLPGSAFTADDYQETFQLLLAPDRDFVRGRRN